jgi:S-disulfanyl-L-cysteine oxidoreductase SoxD
MFKRNIFFLLGVLALTATAANLARHSALADSKGTRLAKDRANAAETARYAVGRAATPADFAKHDYLVGPKGTGLPKGRGTAMEGRAIYMQSCVACHGLRGEGVNDYPPLVGGQGSLKTDKPLPTVGSYWPYATTVWDYVNRAMPYQNPGTLKTDEVYAVTAYLLAMNRIMSEAFELNERTLPTVKMPNREGFVSDPRPDVK